MTGKVSGQAAPDDVVQDAARRKLRNLRDEAWLMEELDFEIGAFRLDGLETLPRIRSALFALVHAELVRAAETGEAVRPRSATALLGLYRQLLTVCRVRLSDAQPRLNSRAPRTDSYASALSGTEDTARVRLNLHRLAAGGQAGVADLKPRTQSGSPPVARAAVGT